MRILELIAGLDIGGAHGGAERFGLELARQLRGVAEVELCAFWQYGTPVEQGWQARLEAEGLPVFFAARWQGRGWLPAYMRGLAAVLKRARAHRYTLAHSHFQFGTLAALGLRRAAGARRVTRTAHVTLEWGPGLARGLLREVFTFRVFPRALDDETGVSRAVVAALRRPDAGLIYNGIDPDLAAREECGDLRSHPGYVIGSVGRLTAQKDYATWLRALAQVFPSHPGASALLVGGGEQRLALERLARELGLEKQLTFLGQHPNASALLQGFDLFVLPSVYEGLPTVLLECAAARVPVVATDIPGTRELVEDGCTGWLVPPGRPDRLAEAICQALDNPQEAARRAGLAEQGLAGFTVERAAAQYIERWKTLGFWED